MSEGETAAWAAEGVVEALTIEDEGCFYCVLCKRAKAKDAACNTGGRDPVPSCWWLTMRLTRFAVRVAEAQHLASTERRKKIESLDNEAGQLFRQDKNAAMDRKVEAMRLRRERPDPVFEEDDGE